MYFRAGRRASGPIRRRFGFPAPAGVRETGAAKPRLEHLRPSARSERCVNNYSCLSESQFTAFRYSLVAGVKIASPEEQSIVPSEFMEIFTI